FGGQVMKNVAGYDVSRLLAGSMGSLGAILDVSLKVLPLPRAQATLRFEMPQQQAIEQLNRWGGQPLPLSASAWWADACGARLYLRLQGARAAVDAACARLGGERVPQAEADALWASLREQTHDWFAPSWQQPPAETLWRIAVPQTTPPLELAGQTLVEWGGTLRWLRSDAEASQVREAATRAGGHATRFRGGDAAVPVFTPPQAPLDRIHRQIKLAFDPHGVFPECFGAA
ncbi:MAG: glycolate oxidase subunit GlcE, partial [Betaproteobacteria bacterium]|nr:glycolate oxidase subunit GlcE [Betaproteobacteria bacterium]